MQAGACGELSGFWRTQLIFQTRFPAEICWRGKAQRVLLAQRAQGWMAGSQPSPCVPVVATLCHHPDSETREGFLPRRCPLLTMVGGRAAAGAAGIVLCLAAASGRSWQRGQAEAPPHANVASVGLMQPWPGPVPHGPRCSVQGASSRGCAARPLPSSTRQGTQAGLEETKGTMERH